MVGIIRWFAYIAAFMAAMIIIVLFVVEDWAWTESGPGAIVRALFLAILGVGLIAGHRWARFGGLLVITGTAGCFILRRTFSTEFASGTVFLAMALPGILYLGGWVLEKRIEEGEHW